jgi:8-oxo-dGTP diphosphatase
MKHLNVVAAIIIYNKQILCMQRGKARQEYVSYKYEFPGGKIENGETRPEALMRELREEMNISVKVSDEDYFLTVHHIYPDFEITLHSFLCPVESQEFVRREHVDHKWMYPEELSSLEWAEADLPIVEKIMEMKIC